MSTALAEDDSDLESEVPDTCMHAESSLIALVTRECSFLRIASCTLQTLDSDQQLRSPMEGVTQCLRVCVNNLPRLKRHTWQPPMAWAVANILQRAGCQAIVKRAQVYVPLGVDSGDLVRVDLCA